VTSPIARHPRLPVPQLREAPFDNMAFRQAIAWAVDRTQIRDIAYFGPASRVGRGAERLDLVRATTLCGWSDVDKAKLAEAGITTPFTIKYLGLPQYPELLKTGEVVRDNLKAIGITMEIEQVEVSVWFDRYVKGDYEITSAYHEGTIDPDFSRCDPLRPRQRLVLQQRGGRP
jgi:peptide/nickel transport system substrate-binding protein